MYMSSNEAKKELLPSIAGDTEVSGREQFNYIIFTIRYSLFATHTLKGPLIQGTYIDDFCIHVITLS